MYIFITSDNDEIRVNEDEFNAIIQKSDLIKTFNDDDEKQFNLIKVSTKNFILIKEYCVYHYNNDTKFDWSSPIEGNFTGRFDDQILEYRKDMIKKGNEIEKIIEDPIKNILSDWDYDFFMKICDYKNLTSRSFNRLTLFFSVSDFLQIESICKICGAILSVIITRNCCNENPLYIYEVIYRLLGSSTKDEGGNNYGSISQVHYLIKKEFSELFNKTIDVEGYIWNKLRKKHNNDMDKAVTEYRENDKTPERIALNKFLDLMVKNRQVDGPTTYKEKIIVYKKLTNIIKKHDSEYKTYSLSSYVIYFDKIIKKFLKKLPKHDDEYISKNCEEELNIITYPLKFKYVSDVIEWRNIRRLHELIRITKEREEMEEHKRVNHDYKNALAEIIMDHYLEYNEFANIKLDINIPDELYLKKIGDEDDYELSKIEEE